MYLEPGIVDANVLVYALDADAPQHAASRGLLDRARRSPFALCVNSQILCEFYSVVTNRRRVANARSGADAVGAIEGFLMFLRVLPIPAAAVEGWLELLRLRPVVGGAIFDLQIASATKANV